MVGDRLEIVGARTTVKLTPLLATPLTVTTTFPAPVLVPVGTGATIEVALQLLGVAVVPLKVSVLDPWLAPKLVPEIVTTVPTAPVVGDKPVIVGAGATLNATPLLAKPPTVTTTFPVVAPLGTGTLMEVALQLVEVAAVPLKVIVLLPRLEPKFDPEIVTDVPTAPEVGDSPVMVGAVATVKLTPLLATPPTVTTTLPVVAPVGTGALIEVALQVVGVAVVPLNFTVLEPWDAPKFVPLMVTAVPTVPEVGASPEIAGVGSTVKLTPLLALPLTVTTTFPVVAEAGTGTLIEVAAQLVGLPETPLKVTVLLPWLEPKLVPVIVTEVPAAPEVGDKLLIVGAVVGTVKATPLLATPPTVTTTLPVLAPVGTGTVIELARQFEGVPAVPLKVTVLLAWLEPKFDPDTVTEVPAAPEVGDRLDMLGVGRTVKLTPPLATPPTVTTTFPVEAPEGTGALIEVALQLVGVEVVPLNFTVLEPWVAPKLVPVIVTTAPTPPEVGERLLIVGVSTTVNATPLLALPLTVTTTFPVVAPAGTGTVIEEDRHCVGVAVVPLNFTVLEPWLEPKPEPEIVTEVPTGPEVGDRLLMVAAAAVEPSPGKTSSRDESRPIDL